MANTYGNNALKEDQEPDDSGTTGGAAGKTPAGGSASKYPPHLQPLPSAPIKPPEPQASGDDVDGINAAVSAGLRSSAATGLHLVKTRDLAGSRIKAAGPRRLPSTDGIEAEEDEEDLETSSGESAGQSSNVLPFPRRQSTEPEIPEPGADNGDAGPEIPPPLTMPNVPPPEEDEEPEPGEDNPGGPDEAPGSKDQPGEGGAGSKGDKEAKPGEPEAGAGGAAAGAAGGDAAGGEAAGAAGAAGAGATGEAAQGEAGKVLGGDAAVGAETGSAGGANPVGALAALVKYPHRPPPAVVMDALGAILDAAFGPEASRILKIIRIGLKYFGESEDNIVRVIWKDPEANIFKYLENPEKQIDKTGLNILLFRITAKLVFVVILSQLITWGTLLVVSTVTLCVIVDKTSYFSVSGAAVKAASYVSGLTDVCDKFGLNGTSGVGGTVANIICNPPTTDADRNYFIKYAFAAPIGCDYTPPAGNVAKFAQAIKDNAAKYEGMDGCALEALIVKESGADPFLASTALVGSDAPGPAIHLNNRTPDGPPANKPGQYGMEFTATERHAIGLTQITIYSPGHWGGSPIPARPEKELDPINKKSSTVNFTVANLLDPNTNIAAGAEHFAYWYYNFAGQVAYKAYAFYFAGQNGPRYYDSTYVQGYKKLYDQCIARKGATPQQ